MSKKRYKNLSRTVNEILDIVPEADKDIVKLTAICNDDVLIENFGRVHGYSDSCAAFINKDLLVEIFGCSLELSGVNLSSARVSGDISSIVFTYTGAKR